MGIARMLSYTLSRPEMKAADLPKVEWPMQPTMQPMQPTLRGALVLQRFLDVRSGASDVTDGHQTGTSSPSSQAETNEYAR